MPVERRKCRCCGAVPLVGYYGLCQECMDATERFWLSRSLKKQRQAENAEREAKVHAIQSRKAEPRPDADGAGLGVEQEGDVQSASGGGGDQ